MINNHIYTFQSNVWVYPGNAPWYFVSLFEKLSKELEDTYSEIKRGWGSLKVRVAIGDSKWNTSIFFDKKSGVYILPIKKEIRKKEGIHDGSRVEVTIEIVL